MNRECDRFDAFLNGELGPDDALRFEAHFVECEACRAAIDQQQWIDELICAPIRVELEPAPVALNRRIRDSILRRRQARLAAAAALFIAAGWVLVLNQQEKEVAESSVEPTAIAEVERSPGPSRLERETKAPPQATFVAGPDVIAVPVKTRDPNITVVRLYPVYQPSYTVQANTGPSTLGGDVDWPLKLNGG